MGDRIVYMFVRTLLFAVVIVLADRVLAANADGDRWSLFDRRLGMFVHWGIYAVDGWHEQQRMRLGMGRAEYEKRAAAFAAERFDADKFVAAAKSLGAGTIC